MRNMKVVSALLLVGTLTLAAPAVASAHPEGRANCRYATQQNVALGLASLGRVQQTFAGVMTGIVTSVEELDRIAGRAVHGAAVRAGAAVAGLAGAAGESARLARAAFAGAGPFGGVLVPAPR